MAIDLQLDDRGLLLGCGRCGQKNRIAYERLGDAAHCGKCKEPLQAWAAPLEAGSAEDFNRLVARATIPVVVDYWAPWCGPCRMVAPELEKVARRADGRFLIAKVNTEALPDLGAARGIRSIPTLAVFVGGREAARSAGARPAPEIEAFIAQSLGH